MMFLGRAASKYTSDDGNPVADHNVLQELLGCRWDGGNMH